MLIPLKLALKTFLQRIIGIDDLQDSAQKFLDRPDDVFGDDDESPDFDQL